MVAFWWFLERTDTTSGFPWKSFRDQWPFLFITISELCWKMGVWDRGFSVDTWQLYAWLEVSFLTPGFCIIKINKKNEKKNSVVLLTLHCTDIPWSFWTQFCYVILVRVQRLFQKCITVSWQCGDLKPSLLNSSPSYNCSTLAMDWRWRIACVNDLPLYNKTRTVVYL